MLRPQNIMIGDWVNVKNYHWDGSPLAAQVDGIIKKHGTYYLQFNDALSAEIDVCEPIKLTFEILEKNGWGVDLQYARLKLDETSYIEWYKHEGVLRKYYVHRVSGVNELIACTPPGLVCVHELQNTFNEWGIWKEVAL